MLNIQMIDLILFEAELNDMWMDQHSYHSILTLYICVWLSHFGITELFILHIYFVSDFHMAKVHMLLTVEQKINK